MTPTSEIGKSDPRSLRGLMDRSAALSREHEVVSVFVGIAGREGDLLVPEYIAFVESALRVEDAIFSMTRERALVLLVDVDRAGAEEIFARVGRDFRERFPSAGDLDVSVCFFEVARGVHPTAKEILPRIFTRK